MKLYGYWRSSAAYRVRIALHYKQIPFEVIPIDLSRGEQLEPSYHDVNPQGLVPTLLDGDRLFHQSLAILEYLEETHPSPPLLPTPPHERARVRALVDLIACDVHPLQNTRVGRYLIDQLGHTEDERLAWFRHWMTVGLTAFEELVARNPATGRFCHGDRLTFADVLLVPQLGNARRVDCDLAAFPTLVRIEAECLALDCFQRAQPSQQPDAVP